MIVLISSVYQFTAQLISSTHLEYFPLQPSFCSNTISIVSFQQALHFFVQGKPSFFLFLTMKLYLDSYSMSINVLPVTIKKEY